MKKYLFYVGIDVSKAKLDINILDSLTLKSEHFIIENNIKSISIFIKKLDTKLDKKCTLFCCENTGVYTNHLSSVLVKLNLDLWIVSAVEIKKSKGISRGKNDKTDAKDISYYSCRNIDKLKLYTSASLDIQKLKMLYTEREKMVKALMLIQATKESKEFTKKIVFKEVSQINQTLVKSIKNSINKIESGIQTASIPLIIATKGFTAFKTWRQFACYSGVAPFEHSSGSSVKGRTRVNHMADKKMKSLLQMCAMTTLKYDSQLKEYYNKKKVEGKNSMLVLNNIRCKLISRIFAVINRETPYINTYKFAS